MIEFSKIIGQDLIKVLTTVTTVSFAFGILVGVIIGSLS